MGNTHQTAMLQIFVRKLVLANQRSEQWFSHVKKNDTSNQNRERCFFTCEKNDTSNQKPQRCVSFAPKFPPFIAACSAASHTCNEKSFTQRVCLAKKAKNISEIEWNSFVCFTVDKENGREPAKQQRKRKNRTRRKLLFCF